MPARACAEMRQPACLLLASQPAARVRPANAAACQRRAQALGSGDSPAAAAAQPEQQSAAGAGEQADLLFHGFGSPLKAGADSPEAAAVSIGAAIPAAAAGLECDAACGDSPASAGAPAAPRMARRMLLLGGMCPSPSLTPACHTHAQQRATSLALVSRSFTCRHPPSPPSFSPWAGWCRGPGL